MPRSNPRTPLRAAAWDYAVQSAVRKERASSAVAHDLTSLCIDDDSSGSDGEEEEEEDDQGWLDVFRGKQHGQISTGHQRSPSSSSPSPQVPALTNTPSSEMRRRRRRRQGHDKLRESDEEDAKEDKDGEGKENKRGKSHQRDHNTNGGGGAMEKKKKRKQKKKKIKSLKTKNKKKDQRGRTTPRVKRTRRGVFRPSAALNEDRYDVAVVLSTPNQGAQTRMDAAFAAAELALSKDETAGAGELEDGGSSGGGWDTSSAGQIELHIIDADSDVEEDDDDDNNGNDVESTVNAGAGEELVLESLAHAVSSSSSSSSSSSMISQLLSLRRSEECRRQRREAERSEECSARLGWGGGGDLVRAAVARCREAGLQVKRVRSLDGQRTILKVRAPAWRLEQEAELHRVLVRTKEGGWLPFTHSRASADIFEGAQYDSQDTLFRSSERQTLVMHILRSKVRYGGAELCSGHCREASSVTARLAAAVIDVFPLHMSVRRGELRRTWVRFWVPRFWGRHRIAGCCWEDGDVTYWEEGKGVRTEGCGGGGHGSRRGGGGGGGRKGRGGMKQNMFVRTFSRLLFAISAGVTFLLRGVLGIWSQPLDTVSDYFGPSIAFYFSWLDFYTKALCVPSLAGILLFFLQIYLPSPIFPPLYAVCLSLWSVFLLLLWRRRSSRLSYRWGARSPSLNYQPTTGGTDSLSGSLIATTSSLAVRPGYRGEWRRSPITDEWERYEALWRCRVKQLLISLPLLTTLTVAMVIGMVSLFLWRDEFLDDMDHSNNDNNKFNKNGDDTPWFAEWSENSVFFGTDATSLTNSLSNNETRGSNGSQHASRSSSSSSSSFASLGDPLYWVYLITPSLLFGFALPVLNLLQKRFAISLTEFENPRTEESFRNALIAKVVPFRLCTTFTLLYYYAFCGRRGNYIKLSAQISSYIFAQLTMNQLTQTLLPWLYDKYQRHRHRRRITRLASYLERRNAAAAAGRERGGVSETAGQFSARRLQQELSPVWQECRQSPYDPFEDYAALLTQFGYVVLFSVVFPLLPSLALCANLIELRTDAFKLCFLSRRHLPRPCDGLGSWFVILTAMTVVGSFTNLAHIGLATSFFPDFLPSLSLAGRVIVLFIVEHVLLLLVFILLMTMTQESDEIVRQKARDRYRGSSTLLHGKKKEEEEEEEEDEDERTSGVVYRV